MPRHLILLLLFPAALLQCRTKQRPGLPSGDKDNGCLLLPDSFETVVVADSIGRARHITVSDNGDIYVKLTYNDVMHGQGGTVGPRDAEGPDGSLYLIESNKGKIWRVMYKGDKQHFGAAQLASMERQKSRTYIKTPDSVKDNLGQGGEMEGLILYNAYCASCHQRDGKGDESRYPPLTGSEWVMGDKDRLIRVRNSK